MKQLFSAAEAANDSSEGVIRNRLPDTTLVASDFNYDLPQEFIAQSPVSPRDGARLMIVDRKTENSAPDIPRYNRIHLSRRRSCHKRYKGHPARLFG